MLTLKRQAVVVVEGVSGENQLECARHSVVQVARWASCVGVGSRITGDRRLMVEFLFEPIQRASIGVRRAAATYTKG
jgi:hypothetical protein